MKYILTLIISLSLAAPVITVAADKEPVTTVEKKVKKKHKKYEGTKIPEKVIKK